MINKVLGISQTWTFFFFQFSGQKEEIIIGTSFTFILHSLFTLHGNKTRISKNCCYRKHRHIQVQTVKITVSVHGSVYS